MLRHCACASVASACYQLYDTPLIATVKQLGGVVREPHNTNLSPGATGDALAPVSTVPHLELRFADLRRGLEISLPQAFLEEAIENNEKVARSHFLDLELGDALFAVDPSIRHDSISVAAHDRLQR